MNSREQRLKSSGYQEPFDESPVDTPEEWEGGDVRNTGGGTMCRVWRNFETNEAQDKAALEVIYNVGQGGCVELIEYKWSGEYYIQDRIVDSTTVENEDHSLAKIAQLYMRKYEMFV